MKRVLVITYHWPPSGGVTVLRCLKIVKYLREFGWEPVVFTARDASYQFEDTSNFKDVPRDLEIQRVHAPEPTNLFKRITGRTSREPLLSITSTSQEKRSMLDEFGIWVRGNFFIPDARALWIRPSVRFLRNYLRTHSIDAIFTDGPPHTNTVIGLRIAQEFKIPWIADFQDPWTQVDYYTDMKIGKRADRIHRALEQEVFSTASLISIASPTWARDLEAIGARNVQVLPYGFDEADFETYKPIPTPGRFILFHGGLLGKDRNPIGLFQALRELLDTETSWAESLEIRLAGPVDVEVQNTIAQYDLMPWTTFLGTIPREEIIRELEQASVLLLPINQASNAAGRIPGKLFELLRSGKPILSFSEVPGDVNDYITQLRVGRTFGYLDSSEIQKTLEMWISDQSDISIPEPSSFKPFSNQALAETVAQWLNQITTKIHQERVNDDV